MNSWKQALRDGALAGSVASVLSTVALVLSGQQRERKPVAPVNATSHWVWGDPALREDRPSLRHTAVGYAIHHAASLFWSTLHMRAWGRPASPPRPGPLLAQAAVTAAAACFVDYRLTPHRFTPGFEHRLGKRQLAGVYVCFALGLAAGAWLSSNGLQPRRQSPTENGRASP
jgi:hypothetical protein